MRSQSQSNIRALTSAVAILCFFQIGRAGEPIGACCDPINTECNAGADAGMPCKTNADCAAPGTCEAVCRETTQANCPWPPPDSDLRPRWQEGKTCEKKCIGGANNDNPCETNFNCPGGQCNPFGSTLCGVAACCHLVSGYNNPEILDAVCDNLTKNECEAAEPVDQPRSWQLGEYCGTGAQQCEFPFVECGTTDKSCYSTHYESGCCDAECCEKVCSYHDPFWPNCPYWGPCYPQGVLCCKLGWGGWTSGCVALANYLCGPAPPSNDSCAPLDETAPCGPPLQLGAMSIPVPGSKSASNFNATTDLSEPGFACNSGTGFCLGGPYPGRPCILDQDCSGGGCSDAVPNPGGQGLGTIWFKFVEPSGSRSAVVDTCASAGQDSILQVFKAADHSSPLAECGSLVPIGCNDDAGSCGSMGLNSWLCLRDLTPGETYYIAVAGKTPNRLGQYKVSISTGSANCAHCPAGEIVFVDPPSGVVDARRPHKPNGPESRQGIRVFQVSGPSDADARCWSFCSTGGSDVSVSAVTEASPGSYRLELSRPLAPGSIAYLGYHGGNGIVAMGRFTSHPGNVNGDGESNPADILALIDHLNGVHLLPWGLYSGDIDRSGVIGPADILTLIDLLNGANGFSTAWNGTPLPNGECP